MRASSCVPATFLLIVALAGDSLPVRLVQPLLPGSWMGREDGQPQILSVSQCHGVLKEVGFSGVDASSTPSFCSVMLSQAVRRPASTAQQLETGVLIVHDPSASAGVTRLASQVATELAQVATVRTAGGLEGIRVPAGAVVLNLCDLDTPTWHKMHERRFEGLQEVMRQASALLWVAEGARAGTTLENTTVLGWGRSARVERTTMYIEQEATWSIPTWSSSFFSALLMLASRARKCFGASSRSLCLGTTHFTSPLTSRTRWRTRGIRTPPPRCPRQARSSYWMSGDS